jgi:anti-sigma factor RsiW
MRNMLPLAVAGALGLEDLSSVEEHTANCAECRRELEILRLYARGLRELPQPLSPDGLLQRTMARVIRERAEAALRRGQGLTLGLLAAFSWAMGVVFWLLVRTVTSGMWKPLGFGTWSLFSAVLAWATAGAAAVVLRRRSELVRRFI